METIAVHRSREHSRSPFKNPRQIQLFNPPFCPMDNFFPPHFHPAGPVISRSYAPYSLSPQPPLLPLPPAANPRRSGPSVRGQSCPPSNNKKGSRNRDASLTPKKSKSSNREEKNSPKKSLAKTASVPSISKELPRPGVAKVLPLNLLSGNVYSNADNCTASNRLRFESKTAEDEISGTMFSGSVAFTISPPPSSLPLPTFSLRPKLGCNAEASAGIDTGATDNFRRLLRLR